MCRIHLRRIIGIPMICFGVGILCSLLLPGCVLALIEALVVIVFGLLLLNGHR